MVTGVGPVRFERLLNLCGSAREAWHASDVQMAQAGLDRRSVHSLRHLRDDTDPVAVMRRLKRLEVDVITLRDESYPALLRQIADPPPVLYVRGRLADADQQGVAIVGTRRATPYGRTVAERLARDLALAGLTVISGLAKGIDTVAHRAALDAGGRTIAVLGNGLDQVYPTENTVLARQIVETDKGAVVSEFPPGIPPDAVNFPRRNRIISGLCAATVIVEAGKRSGALITSDFALEQGREVMAVPGSILGPMSIGPNWLIRQGATPVTGAQDILEALGLSTGEEPSVMARELPGLEGPEASVMHALTSDPRHVDEVAREVGLPAGEVAGLLAMLELKGLVRPAGAMAYVRK